ncbi:MAG: tRNA pseudouridine(13) synthase TruD [Planctomycetota bacterium]
MSDSNDAIRGAAGDGMGRARVVPARYLTDGIAGIGGTLKERAEDFFVEELPLYLPSGSGEHIYLMVEKRGLTAMEMLRVIAKHFRVGMRSLGYAGLKDRVAVTRQVVSVHAPGKKIEDFPQLQHERVSVLWADYHDNKLRRGHLSGNRFSIRVRGVKATDALPVQRALRVLEKTGVPDRFGEQRFGYLLNNHLVGRALFLADYEGAARAMLGPDAGAPDAQREAREAFAAGDYAGAQRAFPKRFRSERAVLGALANGEGFEQAIGAIEADVRSYLHSAFQSAVFNAVLDERVIEGTLGELRAGDVIVSERGRGGRDVDESVLLDDQTRADVAGLEIAASGPMWGPRMKRAGGKTDEAEVRALRAFGVRPEDLERWRDADDAMMGGTRRPLRVALRNVEVEGGVDEHGGYVRCAFDLPRGAFATTVMAEIMKPAEADVIASMRQDAQSDDPGKGGTDQDQAGGDDDGGA